MEFKTPVEHWECEFEKHKDLIFGLDPGKRRTGTVVCEVKEGRVCVLGWRRLKNQELLDALWSWDVQGVVMEDFRLYPWVLKNLAWDHLEEVRLIGAVEEITRRKGVFLEEIQPADSKKMVSDQFLKSQKTWSGNAHIRDAFRILWCYFKKEAK